MDDSEALHAALARRAEQIGILLDALREHDREDAAQREWDFALRLQTGNLPNEFPAFPNRTEFDIRAGMVTAFEVGGDVYDFFLLDERRLAFVVADASGKGLPAAEFITLMRTILRAAARRVADPGDCLTTVNAMLCMDNMDLMFVTAFYGVLDTRTGDVSFANAGHNPPFLVNASARPEPLAHVRAPMLAVMDDLVYRTGHIRMAPGETLVCFSDGIPEAHNEAGELFGDARFVDVLAQVAIADLVGIEAATVGAVDRFIGSAPIADDLTLLMVRWNGPPST
jgi:sigma-B regulation protein RsbU (phosphoserine phosphatase)